MILFLEDIQQLGVQNKKKIMDEWINVSIKQGIEIEKRERPKEEKKEKDRRLSFDSHI